MTNFFGISGFHIAEPPAFADAAAAADYARQAGADIVVLCSTDAEYPALAGALVPALRSAGVAAEVLIAGLPKTGIEEIKAAGVAVFIHIKSNPVEVLTGWQRRLGVID